MAKDSVVMACSWEPEKASQKTRIDPAGFNIDNSAVCVKALHRLYSVSPWTVLKKWVPPEVEKISFAVKTFADLSAKFIEHRNTVREISDSCYWTYETQLNTHILPEDLHLTDIEKLAMSLKKTCKKTQSYLAIRRDLLCSSPRLDQIPRSAPNNLVSPLIVACGSPTVKFVSCCLFKVIIFDAINYAPARLPTDAFRRCLNL